MFPIVVALPTDISVPGTSAVCSPSQQEMLHLQ